MAFQSSTRLTRALLFVSVAVVSTTAISPVSRAAASADAVQDLGEVAAASQVSATIWLKPHSEQALETAIARRMEPGSPDYHHWMTQAEVAAYGVTADEASGLVTSLKASGLQVAMRGDGTGALRVTGTASALSHVFNTTLHQFKVGNAQYRAPVAEPRLSGSMNTMVAGITGLATVRMTPYAIRQVNFATGKPVQYSLADAADPSTVFTDDCFVAKRTLALAHFIPNGGTEHFSVTGPGYLATGVDPATATCGYTAKQASAHYGLDAVYRKGYQGEGQTIVLVDAYGSPTIQADANTFSKMMGLPALTATNFKVVYPDGPPIANPYPTGWPVEVSLDVEWAHAIAPKAKLVLVVAPSDDADELTYAMQYAVSHKLGEVISNSYRYAEAAYGPATARAFNSVIRQAAAQGIAVNVSTGDSGDFGLGRPYGAASIPADSPYATGVGGTSLGIPSDNGPVETSWGSVFTDLGDINGIDVPPGFEGFRQGGGGGQSAYLEKPKWQKDLVGTGRMLPDVSAFADPFTGAIIVTPSDDGTQTVVEVIGGTSLSSPVFSAIWALADQAAGTKLGQAAPIISRMAPAALTDIVPVQASLSNLSGSIGTVSDTEFYSPAALLDIAAIQPNGFVGVGAQVTSPTAGIGSTFDFSFGADSSLIAQPGWDDATGYGVPSGLAFIRAAAKAAR